MSWLFPDWRKVVQRCEPLFPGLFVSGFVISLSYVGLIRPLENIARDVLILWRGEQSWSDEIVLIDIDNGTLKELGQVAQLRPHYVSLLNFLADSGNRVVAFDVLLSEETEDDALLAQAMAEHNGVVLAETIDDEGELLHANPLLLKSAIASGHIDDYSDDFDGVTRRHRLYINNSLSLAAATAQAYSLTTDILHLPNP
ncbi:MAG: CHASE2 domain-containing protein, partial [Cyanobacteria bacterium P01_F01_bin.3]